MLRSFHEHGILQKMTHYLVLMFRVFLRSAHKKIHLTEENTVDQGNDYFDGFNWKDLVSSSSYSATIKNVQSNVHYTLGPGYISLYGGFLNRIMEKLTDSWGSSHIENSANGLRGKSIFIIVNTLWEVFYYDELYLLGSSEIGNFVELADKCKRALNSCLGSAVSNYTGQNTKSFSSTPGSKDGMSSPVAKQNETMRKEMEAFLQYGGMSEDEFDSLLNMGFEHAKILNACDKSPSRDLQSILDFLLDPSNYEYLETHRVNDVQRHSPSSADKQTALKPPTRAKKRITIFNSKNKQQKSEQASMTPNSSKIIEEDRNQKELIKALLKKSI